VFSSACLVLCLPLQEAVEDVSAASHKASSALDNKSLDGIVCLLLLSACLIHTAPLQEAVEDVSAAGHKAGHKAGSALDSAGRSIKHAADKVRTLAACWLACVSLTCC
jgi:hypothetical protein